MHVIDASNESWTRQRDVVLHVLDQIEAADKPIIQAFNQADKLNASALETLGGEGIVISAKQGIGLEALLSRVVDALGAKSVTKTLLIPYDKGALTSRLHELAAGEVQSEYAADGVKMTLTLDGGDWERIRSQAEDYVIEE